MQILIDACEQHIGSDGVSLGKLIETQRSHTSGIFLAGITTGVTTNPAQ
ncbi:hypothetical protein [Phyllobacterium sp.]|nr:hypothetical protein [Phyllobacterium sp.]